MPEPLDYELNANVFEIYAQDKWQIKNGLTLSLGVRYDLEVIPIDETGNPLFSDPTAYPVDKNNIAPRLGFVWNPDGEGKSVVRGGYGLFYDRTLLGTIDNFLFDTKYARSFVAQFPQNAADPGPSNGRFPTDPTLANPTVEPDHAGDPRLHQFPVSAGRGAPQHRHGHVGRSRAHAAVLSPDHRRLRARGAAEARRCRRTTSGWWGAICSSIRTSTSGRASTRPAPGRINFPDPFGILNREPGAR